MGALGQHGAAGPWSVSGGRREGGAFLGVESGPPCPPGGTEQWWFTTRLVGGEDEYGLVFSFTRVEGATTDEVGQTRTVRLPRSNLFTPDQLLGIMRKLGEQEGGF